MSGSGNTYDYSKAKKMEWLANADLFSKKRLFFPINITNYHWLLIIACLVKFYDENIIVIHHYDSFCSKSISKEATDEIDNLKHMIIIKKFLQDESIERNHKELADNQFIYRRHNKSIPQQSPKSNDCAAFVMKCADYTIDDLILTYNQEDMADFRIKIGIAIMQGSLSYNM